MCATVLQAKRNGKTNKNTGKAGEKLDSFVDLSTHHPR